MGGLLTAVSASGLTGGGGLDSPRAHAVVNEYPTHFVERAKTRDPTKAGVAQAAWQAQRMTFHCMTFHCSTTGKLHSERVHAQTNRQTDEQTDKRTDGRQDGRVFTDTL